MAQLKGNCAVRSSPLGPRVVKPLRSFFFIFHYDVYFETQLVKATCATAVHMVEYATVPVYILSFVLIFSSYKAPGIRNIVDERPKSGIPNALVAKIAYISILVTATAPGRHLMANARDHPMHSFVRYSRL